MNSADISDARKLIVIVGFMGAGKTTIARELARLLRCRAIDLDELITERERRSPGEIIAQTGEDEFRRIETETLKQVLDAGRANAATHILAVGGGAWTIAENRELIHEHQGVAIWLDAPFELCWERIQASGGRPLAPNQLQTRMLYAERRVIYALAEIHLPLDLTRDVAEICGELVEALRTKHLDESA